MVDLCDRKLSGALLLIVFFFLSIPIAESIDFITSLTSLFTYNGNTTFTAKNDFLSYSINVDMRLVIDFRVTNRLKSLIVTIARSIAKLEVVLNVASPHDSDVICAPKDKLRTVFNCSGFVRFLVVRAHEEVGVNFSECIRYPIYLEFFAGCYTNYNGLSHIFTRSGTILDCMRKCQMEKYFFAGLSSSGCECFRETHSLSYEKEKCELNCPSVVECLQSKYISLFYFDLLMPLEAQLINLHSVSLYCMAFEKHCGSCAPGMSGITCNMRDCSKISDLCGKGTCHTFVLSSTKVDFCNCKKGYVNLRDSECMEIDECHFLKPCDLQHGRCQNTEGGYKCSCNQGYKIINDICHVIDECETLKPCDPQHGLCQNTDRGYVCSCTEGYINEDDRCHDLDECKTGTHCIGVGLACNNSIGSFICFCGSGFNKSNNGNCSDIDECLLENCSSTQGLCQNVIGSFSCGCLKGYQQASNTMCEDVDECLEYGICDLSTATCFNSLGTYACVCKQGYENITNNYKCSDVDECTRMISTCNQAISKCLNTVGDYSCECFAGYSRGNSNKECLDLDYDECVMSHLCDPSSTRCVNIVGSYHCVCLGGYTVHTKYKCLDIDECNEQEYFCDEDGTCVNTPGSYKCDCGQGLRNVEGYTCEDIDECKDTRVCNLKTSSCINYRKGYRCMCNQFHETFSNECISDGHIAKGAIKDAKAGTNATETFEYPDNFIFRYFIVITSLTIFLYVAKAVFKSVFEEEDGVNIVHEDIRGKQADQSGLSEMFEEAKSTEV